MADEVRLAQGKDASHPTGPPLPEPRYDVEDQQTAALQGRVEELKLHSRDLQGVDRCRGQREALLTCLRGSDSQACTTLVKAYASCGGPAKASQHS